MEDRFLEAEMMTLKELLDIEMPSIDQPRCMLECKDTLQYQEHLSQTETLYWKEFKDILMKFNSECDKVTKYKFESFKPDHPKKFDCEQDIAFKVDVNDLNLLLLS